MSALQLFQDGRLQEAIRFQETVVRESTADSAARLLLAELLLFNGEIDAVRRCLDGLPRDLPGMAEYLDAYSQLLDAESRRQQLFLDADPQFPDDPPEHVALRFSAVRLLREGRPRMAVGCIDEADANVSWLAGHVDGREFEGARDIDDIFGPILEAHHDGQYIWFPMEQIRRLRLGPIESLRDQLFVPAVLKDLQGDEWHLHLPAIYPGSHEHDDLLRSGQSTDWTAIDDGPMRGMGLRILALGDEELSLHDFRMWECKR